jgi:hypothetical protein
MSKPVEKLCDKLKKQVAELNETMTELETLGVEARISYVESSPSKNITQGINLWRLTQHTEYL